MNFNSYFTIKHTSNLRILLLTLFFIVPLGTIYGQNQLITIAGKNITLLKAFDAIESQTQLSITYSRTKIDVNRTLSVDFKKQKLSIVLDKLLAGTGFTYKIEKGYIVLVPVPVKQEQTEATSKKIQGVIVDTNGDPVIGASIQEKGVAGKGTVSDLDGKFNLSVASNAVLLISYIGFQSLEVKVGNRTSLSLVLKEDHQLLDEVVVIGYGTMEKRAVTSSITSISSKDLVTGLGGSTIATALKGKISGMNVSETSSPNASASFQLRGVASINASSSPLIVIDGIPGGDLRSISQEDIQSIDVLKDASAGAIMASAFVELSTYVSGELGKQFLSIGEQQIKSLASPAYRAKKVGDNNHFIIQHCTGFMGKQYEIDAPLTYADYYFVEALIRYKNLLEGRPVVQTITAFSENEDRSAWLSALHRISYPLLSNMAKGELRKNMPVESIAADMQKRREVTHLEALGRLITGISAWLELGPDSTIEGRLRAEYIDLSLKSIANGVNPASPDYLNFNKGRQPLVDAAFLAHGLLRARTQLWDKLDKTTQERVIKELKSSRVIKPSETNWLFFAAMVEAALKEFTGEWEYERVKYACDRFAQWYKGDGWYGDGADFHLDYYNSFVIHPMMVEVLTVMKKHGLEGAIPYELELSRYARYAEQQERLISPEGTFPIVGRSLAYRFGAFHALSDVAYRKLLPSKVIPAQVRCALTAVINRQINAPGTFNPEGWLRVGFAGYQPHIGETYISTGSLYLCTAVFVALGLPESDVYWSSPATAWTCKKGWEGIDLDVDKALKK